MLVRAYLESSRRFPNKLAVQDQAQKLSYRRLERLIRALRRVVLEGTELPRVGVMLPGSAGGVATLFGALWAGKVAVPLNFLLQRGELEQIIADADIDLIISTIHLREQLEAMPVRVLYLEELPLKRKYILESVRFRPPVPAPDPDETAVILYTSGTTGRPKGVCLTQNNILSNALSACEHLQLDDTVHLLGIIPPFHVFGLTVVHFLPMIRGGSVTFIPRFSPQATYRAIQTQGVNLLLGVPSMYGAIARLKSIDRADFSGIRIAASGGEALSPIVYDLFKERTGITLIEGYGLTETSPILAADFPDTHRRGTVGKPLRDVEVQLRDEEGKTVTDGCEGELFVRGPMVMQGYFKQPEETRNVIDAQGWFRTGDIVRIEDGYISITGRAKDLVIVGGENVYPREVENVLERYPGLAEAAVIGRPDSSRGEVVEAYVTAEAGIELDANELRSFCREHLAGFKVPREVHVRKELPRGPTGKILKRELRKLKTGSERPGTGTNHPG
jgi:long-chain acyl-CoA synthetase